MKKLLFFIVAFVVTFCIGYLCEKHILFGAMLDNAHYLSGYSAKEKNMNIFYSIPFFVILIIIILLSCLLGNKLMKSWHICDYIISAVSALISWVAAFALFFFLHP